DIELWLAEQPVKAWKDDFAVWQRWGPYVSERAWGTVREDYSRLLPWRVFPRLWLRSDLCHPIRGNAPCPPPSSGLRQPAWRGCAGAAATPGRDAPPTSKPPSRISASLSAPSLPVVTTGRLWSSSKPSNCVWRKGNWRRLSGRRPRWGGPDADR